MSIPNIYNIFLQAKGISTDTRTIVEGQLFFALQGDNFDGNQYAELAIQKGAIAAIVSSKDLIGDQYIYVEDTLIALQELARHHRNQFNIPVIGLTGSNGKTTTKELLLRTLSTSYSVLATVGNLNNHIGVPLTILCLTKEHDIAIVEMGANHLNEIDSYCQIANPTHGVITNIGLAHIGEFGGEQNILKAKTELFKYVLYHDGVIFFDEKEEKLNLYQSIPQAVYASSSKTDFSILCLRESPKVHFEIRLADQEPCQGISVLGGKYNFQNISLALTVGHYFSCPLLPMIRAIETYIPNNKRSQIIHTKRNTIYLDAYNANPSSMKLAIDYFLGLNHKASYLILGDMKELGEYSHEEHQKLYSYISKRQSEYIECFYVGTEFCKLNINNAYTSVNELKASMQQKNIESGNIFVKGSRSIYLEQVVNVL